MYPASVSLFFSPPTWKLTEADLRRLDLTVLHQLETFEGRQNWIKFKRPKDLMSEHAEKIIFFLESIRSSKLTIFTWHLQALFAEELQESDWMHVIASVQKLLEAIPTCRMKIVLHRRRHVRDGVKALVEAQFEAHRILNVEVTECFDSKGRNRSLLSVHI
jgi:hypothetical protein